MVATWSLRRKNAFGQSGITLRFNSVPVRPSLYVVPLPCRTKYNLVRLKLGKYGFDLCMPLCCRASKCKLNCAIIETSSQKMAPVLMRCLSSIILKIIDSKIVSVYSDKPSFIPCNMCGITWTFSSIITIFYELMKNLMPYISTDDSSPNNSGLNVNKK